MKASVKFSIVCAVVLCCTPLFFMPRSEENSSDKQFQARVRLAERMATEACEFLKTQTIGKAFKAFETDPKWHVGELFIAVFNKDGDCYLHGDETWSIWERFGGPAAQTRCKAADSTGMDPATFFLKDMLEKARVGGWVAYEWNKATRYAYVKTVKVEGEDLIVNVGFFPDSPRFTVQRMVQSAIRYGEERGAAEMFQQINNTLGRFVYGDIYLWAYDLEGNVFAHGRNLAYIGQSRLDWKDSRGRYRNKIMIETAKRDGHGWINYEEEGVDKLAYFEVFTDPRTHRQYIVGGGYYPSVNESFTKAFVKQAVSHLRSQGSDVAFRDFTSFSGGFVKGPLRIFVYNLDGVMLADGQNPLLIGQNLMNARDADGKYIVREILKAAKEAAGLSSSKPTESSGIVTFKDRGAYKVVYVEYVEVPDGKYIIGAGFWPLSKEHAARSLLEKAFGELERKTAVDAFRSFSSEWGGFVRGDLFIRVYTDDGFCLVNGLDTERIWNDETKALDEDGFPIFEKLRSTALQGGGEVDYQLEHGTYRSLVKMVKKPIEVEVPEKKLLEEIKQGEKVISVSEQQAREEARVAEAEHRDRQYRELMDEPPTLARKVIRKEREAKKPANEMRSIISVGYYL